MGPVGKLKTYDSKGNKEIWFVCLLGSKSPKCAFVVWLGLRVQFMRCIDGLVLIKNIGHNGCATSSNNSKIVYLKTQKEANFKSNDSFKP